MTKLRLLVLLVVVAFVMALIPAVASAQVAAPCRIHGTVQVDGANVAVGTVITATVDGDSYTATTPSAYGASTYRIEIAQPAGKSYDGKTVTFMIGADTAAETATWQQGRNLTVNLNKGVPPTPTPTPTPPPTPTPEPTGVPGPKGDKGDTGAAGSKGDTGAAGPKGDTGAAGSKGDTGAAGATGATGDQGEAGDDASAALGIIGLIVAIVALLAVGYVVIIRKPKAA